MDAAYDVAKKVFGAVGVSRAKACAKTKEAMLETVRTYLAGNLVGEKTFKVESKRADKSFPMTSIQLSQWVGGELDELYPNLHVDVHNPALTIHLEVRDYAAFVHADPEPGAGGLPVGTSGRAMSLLSGGIDSPVASWMMAKRGVALEMVHFYSYPYTSPEAKEKVLDLARLLTPWTGRLIVHVVPFTHIQEELRRACPEELFTLLMRRFMMRIAEGPPHRLPGPGHRRVSGPGGLPDHGRHGGHRSGRLPARVPASGGHGQGGGGPHRPKNRHLRDLHPPL